MIPGNQSFHHSWRPTQIFRADFPKLSQTQFYQYQQDLEGNNQIEIYVQTYNHKSLPPLIKLFKVVNIHDIVYFLFKL